MYEKYLIDILNLFYIRDIIKIFQINGVLYLFLISVRISFEKYTFKKRNLPDNFFDMKKTI